ncbi:hypothetical protein A8L34_01465 [Bacillus sp. FJAT-27264]|uniref:DUF4231 domain-containing protein n=1 Tax=Paenibacillus sp. (strain DSM 101736 / FJAT-27264) TaxID=1850362 RepID=UPI0008080975|nr:DUF4231 domain-containing protein [Bacillus sp. FJAT-27264]OBZ18281.1 hypothetical protein A8L34_01465 [Bacillus sp. FJAT-27264]
MLPEKYIEARLDHQIDWYDKKSISAQKTYKRLQTFELIFAALIPLLSGYTTSHKFIPVIVAVLGTLIVILAGLSRLGKYHENWTQYRATCELLRHEKFLYLTGTNPYEEKSFQLLVSRVESFVSAENINWSQLATSDDNKN